jgi:hypothetical protein
VSIDITEDGLADYVEGCRYNWQNYALSSGVGSLLKKLEFQIGLTTPLYRVTHGDRTIYIGSLKETAVREYNALP